MAVRSRSWRELVQYLGMLLGLLMLGWFLWTLDWNGLIAVLGRVRWTWVGVAAVIMLVDYALHAWRWRILLHHVDPGVDAKTLWRATTILWAFNTLLPLRAGNLLRPAVVTLVRGAPYAAVLVTTVAETVCDVVGIAVLVLWMLWLMPGSVADSEALARVQMLGAVGAVAAIAGLAGAMALSSSRARRGLVRALESFPYDRIRTPMLAGFDQLVMGLGAVGEPIRFLQAIGVTMLVWVGWLLAILATLRAFDLDVPLAGALFVETTLTLSMMLPQAPGFLGVFQVVLEDALGLFGAPRSEAEAVALVFWMVCFVPVTVLGVYDAWRIGLSPSGEARPPE